MSRAEANHERARSFALKHAMRPGTSELVNLSRCYLTAMQSISELAQEIAELRKVRPIPKRSTEQ